MEERYNLRSENELASEASPRPPARIPAVGLGAPRSASARLARQVEDNLLFERRSATSLAEAKTIVGTGADSSLFARDNDDASKDGSTILLTDRDRFGKVVVLGAPACGKTTLLQKMRYWAALAAYEDPDQNHLPVFIALVRTPRRRSSLTPLPIRGRPLPFPDRHTQPRERAAAERPSGAAH